MASYNQNTKTWTQTNWEENLPTNQETNWNINNYQPAINANPYFTQQQYNTQYNNYMNNNPEKATHGRVYMKVNDNGYLMKFKWVPDTKPGQLGPAPSWGNHRKASWFGVDQNNTLSDIIGQAGKQGANESTLKKHFGTAQGGFAQNIVWKLDNLQTQNANRPTNATNFAQGKKTTHDNTALKNRNTMVNGINATNLKIKNANIASNKKGKAVNDYSKQVIHLANTTQGGDWLAKRGNLPSTQGMSNAGVSSTNITNLSLGANTNFRNFYINEKVDSWDPDSQGKNPLTGKFDAKYYRNNENTALQAKWDTAVNLDNLDITHRYGDIDLYSHADYSGSGKAAGLRGNEAQEAVEAVNYAETMSDAEMQLFREKFLGLTKDSDSDELTVDWDDENEGYLEVAADTVMTAKDIQEQAKFGALTQDVLKTTINKLKEAKKQENTASLYNQLPGYSEIHNMSSNLANSLLGDSGVGGYLGMISNTEEMEEGLEETISGITGVPSSNSAVHNWQKWFDEELITKYENMETIDNPNAEEDFELDQEFREKFIERYLKPRFDTSKSMDEFISYMDVTQEEENIFQTQSAMSSLKLLGEVRAKTFYGTLQEANKTIGTFDTDFYFNPGAEPYGPNKNKQDTYDIQGPMVTADWEEAKNNPKALARPVDDPNGWTWEQWAYTHGLDLNDRDDFAKLHYQVKGRFEHFDPAEDNVTVDHVKDFIDTSIIPAMEKGKLDLEDLAFLDFVTPEEFADHILDAVSPEENREEWEKLLEMYGFDPEDDSLSLEQLKEYIVDAIRTGEAKAIRESIKYLNEKSKKPTQKELGVTYIERDEDDTKEPYKGKTDLFAAFQNAGYQGSEESFYNDFMPDADINEQIALTTAGAGETFEGKGFMDSDDPFENLMNLEEFFAPPKKSSSSSSSGTDKDSYFNLFGEKEDNFENDPGASPDEITSSFSQLFQGFN